MRTSLGPLLRPTELNKLNHWTQRQHFFRIADVIMNQADDRQCCPGGDHLSFNGRPDMDGDWWEKQACEAALPPFRPTMKERPASKTPGTPKRRSVVQPARHPGKNFAPVVRQLSLRAKAVASAGPPGERSSLAAFNEIVALIERSRCEPGRAVNVQLIELYWKIGAVISTRIERDGWGKGTVAELAAHPAGTQAGACGFSPQNLWRMRQSFEADRKTPNLSTALREVQPKAARPSEAPLQCKLNELYAQHALGS